MTVYADSLFLINFISEYMLLTLTEKISSVKAKKFRREAAAIFGAAVSVIIFCTDIPLPQAVLGALNAFLISCAAYMCDIRAVMRAFPIFMLISHIYSGIAAAVSGLLSVDAVIRGGIIYMNIDAVLFILIFTFTYLFVLLCTHIIKRKSRRIYTVTVSLNEKSVSFKALFDSGNLLTDGTKGVIIAEWDIVKKLFDTEFPEALYGTDGTKIIPLRSVAGDSAVLVFYADFAAVENNTFTDVPIGIIHRRLSENGGYGALLGKQYI